MAALASCTKEKRFVLAKPIPTKADSLNTEAEVDAYIDAIDTTVPSFRLRDFSEIGTLYDTFVDNQNRVYAHQLGLDKTFYKTDFNNDGLTDILFIGGYGSDDSASERAHYIFKSGVIINGGKNRSTVFWLDKNHFTAFVPQIRNTDSLPLIILHQPRRIDNIYRGFKQGEGYVRAKDSAQVKLVYHSGHFVEYNPVPIKHHRIEKIQFSASPCFGTCPWFEMILERDRDSWLIAKSHNFEKKSMLDTLPFKEEGAFKGKIKETAFDDIEALLNYIDFVNLRDEYTVRHTDDTSASVIITYDDGKVKRIYDYGQTGTYGLMAFYKKIADLRFSQKWIKAKEPQGIRMKQFFN